METHTDTLLVLNAPPQLEDDLVDYLSSLEQLSVFSSYPVHGHDQHAQHSIAEQVSGRSRRVQFEMILAKALATELLGGLRSAVGPGIYYWHLPVSGFGHID